MSFSFVSNDLTKSFSTHTHVTGTPVTDETTTTNAMFSASSHTSASPTMPTYHARLTTPVWANSELSVKYNIWQYVMPVHCCMTAIYARQDRLLNSSTRHLRSIRRILGRSWQEQMSNAGAMYCFSLPLCTSCEDNADCDGWVMTTVLRMAHQQGQSGTQKECSNSSRPETTHGCDFCDKVTPALVGLFSQSHPLLQPNKQLATSGWITHGHLRSTRPILLKLHSWSSFGFVWLKFSNCIYMLLAFQLSHCVI